MYSPEQDSFLLSDCLKRYLKNRKGKNKEKDKEIKILDMGSGSGIQAKTCQNLGFNNTLCCDIDPETVKYLKKSGFKTIKSDLFSNPRLKNKKFDLIIFNPPYLPEDKFDKEKDTTGGKKGYETISRFLEQVKKHLTDGTILLLYSSLSSPNIIKQKIKHLGFKYTKLAEKQLVFEKLYVIKIKR